MLEEPVDLAIVQEVVGLALMGEDQRTGRIVEINSPGLPGFVESIKKGGLILPEDKIIQIGMFVPSGMSTRPEAVPEKAKKRFGQVGSGTEENQRSQIVKSRAIRYSACRNMRGS